MPNEGPFSKRTFCCTGILRARDELAQKIEALGGIHYSDLMSDVNYLIVGDRDTAKYKFCVKNRVDIKFLNQDCIFKIYELWLKGEDDDSDALDIDNYLLPVFESINVCFSRIDIDIQTIRQLLKTSSFRLRMGKNREISDFFDPKTLMETITKQGGKWSESLTISNTCVVTTEKVGRRYSKAIEWHKPVVHPVWVFDSLLRGAALDFKDYLLNDQNEANFYNDGCEIWDQLDKEKKITPTLPEVAKTTEEPRKRLKKNTEVWNSIMDTSKSFNKNVIKDSMWDEEEEPVMRRSTILIPSESVSLEDKTKNIFAGLNFLLIGFNSQQTSLLSGVIENQDGEVTSDATDSTITHIILPASQGSQSSMMLRILSPAIKSKITNGDIKVVTEWFVERSIFYKKIVLDRWGQPMKGLLPSTRKFKICVTGFTGIELLHVEKLIKSLNFEFCESLTLKRDLLVININLFKSTLMKNSPKLYQYKYPDVINCPTYQSGTSSVSILSSKNKINAAKDWQIPIVSVAYLWEILDISAGKTMLSMPNILDLTWCLFAPSKYNRPLTLLEYVKNLCGQNLETDSPSVVVCETMESTDTNYKIRLPSPRKVKKKQKYGRLVGRDSPESLTTKLMKVGGSDSLHDGDKNSKIDDDDGDDDEDDDKNCDVTNLEDDLLTQVQYHNDDSERNDQELLKRLEGDREQPRRARKVSKYTR